MKNFKFFGGEKVNNVATYVRNYIKKYPETNVIVGTDSGQYNNYTNYVTVICMNRPTKGSHIIYQKNKVPKIKDLFSKLWEEVEYTRIIADELDGLINDDQSKKLVTVHIDINDKKTAKSSMVHDSAMGYLKGLGYSVESKPNSWVATKAADWLC